jgi:ABC-type nitrate/sulfonate/bicarbonate transport system permease component
VRAPRKHWPLHDVLRGPGVTRFILPLALLAIWEAGVAGGMIPALFFPAPSTVFGHFLVMFGNGELQTHLGATLRRVATGVILGGGAGLVVGLAMGWSRAFNTATGDLVSMAHPLPKISLLPLFFVIFGYGETTRLVLIGLSAFFPMIIASRTAIRNMDPALLEVCRNYGIRGRLCLRRMILPACKPFLLAGLQLAINTALIVALSIEMLSSNTGLGAVLWLGWQTMRLEDIYVALFLIAAFGVLANSLIFKSERLEK